LDVEHLIVMANQIGQFYEALPNHDEAVANTANHLRRFWDPRMRRALLARFDEDGGRELRPLVLEAVQRHRASLEPNTAFRAT
jgi:formate dehydrogenase subunit delta